MVPGHAEVTLMVNSRNYHASLLWTLNVAVGATLGLVGAVVVPVVFVRYFQGSIASEVRLPLLALFVVSALSLYLAYFPGNLGVLWPYAVDIRANEIELSGPFKKVIIPMSDVEGVEDSFFWQGYVFRLRKPHAALTQFVLPWYFGQERNAVADAIRAAQNKDNL